MLWIETKAVHHPLDHGARGTDLSLANGAGCLDIHDDGVVFVDQIVGGISEERRPTVGAGPLGSGIGGGDELWHDLARCAEGSIIECREIILHRLQRIQWKIGGIPFLAWNGALLVGIGLDQAGIDGKTFTTDKPFIEAALHDLFEHAPEKITLTKAAMAIFRKRRMVRHPAIQTKTAKPSISEVQMNLFT